MLHGVVAHRLGSISVQQDGQQIAAVRRGVRGQCRAAHRGTGGHHVGERDRLGAGAAGLHLARPADDERHPVPAFPVVAFHAAPRSRAVVPVIRAHVNHRRDFRAVVAGKHHQRVVRDAEFLQRVHQFADDRVELVDEIAVRSRLGLAAELVRRERRQMHGSGGVIEEERLARLTLHVLLQKLFALLEEDHIHFLDVVVRRDHAQPVVVRIRVLGQLALVEQSGGRHRNAVADDERIQRVRARTAGGAEEAVEAAMDRRIRNRAREINAFHASRSPLRDGLACHVEETQPHMPLARHRGRIATLAQHLRQRELSLLDQTRPARADEHRHTPGAERHLARSAGCSAWACRPCSANERR